MKKLSTVAVFMFTAVFAFSQNNDAKQAKSSMADMPYKATYSSNFQIGDQKYSRVILNFWKFWDDNKIDNMSEFVADTITAILPDGTLIKGRENFIKSAKEYRSTLASSKSEVDAFTTLKTPDHPNDQVVCIWGTETDIKKDGSTQKIALQEVWAFNKDGKVFYFRQFMGQEPKDMK